MPAPGGAWVPRAAHSRGARPQVSFLEFLDFYSSFSPRAPIKEKARHRGCRDAERSVVLHALSVARPRRRLSVAARSLSFLRGH